MASEQIFSRIGYLGPEGTFTHQALESHPASRGSTLVSYSTIFDVIRAVEQRDVDAGMVPIENSIEGAVTATLDGLAQGGSDVRIAAEVMLPIRFDLFVAPGMESHPLKEVQSHPHAFGQCRGLITERRLITNSFLSTAEACRVLRDNPRPGVAAIASGKTGVMYGLVAVERNVGDVADAVTRFVLLSASPTHRTGWDKTSLVLTPMKDRPGSLVEILEVFSSRGINLSRIESRPLKTRLGQYCFFIDAWGHMEDPLLGGAVRSLSRQDVDVKFLGSYPNASPRPASALARVVRSDPKRPWAPIERVGVCGLGLIGGSFAYALGMLEGVKVTGYDVETEASMLAAAGGIPCTSSLKELAERSDLIVVAVPMAEMERTFRDMAPFLSASHIVSDVGSVKAPVIEAARRALPANVAFVAGHPMAGSERSGHAAARADLFRRSAWILTFDEKVKPEPFLRVAELVLRIEAGVVPMSVDLHDGAVALISHVPHVLAFSMMASAAESSARSILFDLAAGSFRGLVRVAGAPPQSWSEICRMNSARVREALEGFLRKVADVESALKDGDGDRIRDVFRKGHAGHRQFLGETRTDGSVEIAAPPDGHALFEELTKIEYAGARIDRMDLTASRIAFRTSVRAPA